MSDAATEHKDMRQVRLDKLQSLRDRGIKPYGGKYDFSHTIGEVLADFKDDEVVSIAGRIMANRKQGKVYFIDLQDQSGRIQLFLRMNKCLKNYGNSIPVALQNLYNNKLKFTDYFVPGSLYENMLDNHYYYYK